MLSKSGYNHYESMVNTMPATHESPRSLPQTSVLLAQGDATLCNTLKYLLEHHGIPIYTSQNKLETIHLIDREHPSVIVLDSASGEVNSLHMLHHLKTFRDDMDGVPIIFLTQHYSEYTIQKILHKGAYACFDQTTPAKTLRDQILHLRRAHQRTLLIADNNALIREALKHRLEAYGFFVLTTQDGLQALDIIAEHKPDMLVAERMLPSMEGDALLHRLRNHPETQKMPVVLMGTDDTAVDRKTVLERGAVDYFIKPLILEEAAARCKEIVEQYAV